jgi:hypothetical protein
VNGFHVTIDGADAIAGDFELAAEKMPRTVRVVTEAAGERLRDGWRANAKATAGTHGRFYPSSITAETIPTFAGATVDVGPESGRRQGGMGPGFEYGSVNQPPHLDGKRAADAEAPRYLLNLDAAIRGLL